MTDPFIADVRRFGGKRAMARLEHADRVQRFKSRQCELAVMAVLFGLAFLFTSHPLFAAMASLVMATGERECRRMRACGRYMQCKRSLEVIGI